MEGVEKNLKIILNFIILKD